MRRADTARPQRGLGPLQYGYYVFEPGAEGTVYEYVRLKEFVASLFDAPVDVIDRDALKPHLRAPAERDMFYAF